MFERSGDITGRTRRRRCRRGIAAPAFTLLEALVASVILGASVLAVISAMSATQNLAFEGQKRVLGAMAIDDLMIELATLPYAQLAAHPPITQGVGQMETLDGSSYPPSYWAIGRTMTVTQTTVTDPKSGAVIRGARVVITALDETSTLCSVEGFFAEPVGGGS